MFLTPSVAPKTLEQLDIVRSDDADLKQQENLFQEQMKRLSEHLKGSTVLGQEPPTPENSDEEAMTEEMSEEDGGEDTSGGGESN